jgi:hypothetical protein
MVVALKSIVRNFFSCVEVLVRECFWFCVVRVRVRVAEWPLQAAGQIFRFFRAHRSPPSINVASLHHGYLGENSNLHQGISQ